MFVGTNFIGDDNDALAWVQHDLWFGMKSSYIWQGERGLPACNYLFEEARSAFLLNTAPNPLFFPEREKLPEIESFDHRVLQYAHSLIAAHYRWLHRNTKDRPAFAKDDDSYRRYLMENWIYYLRREVPSLVNNLEIAEAIVRMVALQNTQDGYDAEDRLAELLKTRYCGEFMEAWEAQKPEQSA